MIRPEDQSDHTQVRAVHTAAFPTTAEADLVDMLRANENLLISLVAWDGSQLVGHVAFSPVSIQDVSLSGVGLAPLAVLPSHQHRGFGGRLVRAGLEACRDAGMDYVVVLGEPEYYGRFGFRPAATFGLENEYDAGDAFMVLELKQNCLSEVHGLVQYGGEFHVVS